MEQSVDSARLASSAASGAGSERTVDHVGGYSTDLWALAAGRAFDASTRYARPEDHSASLPAGHELGMAVDRYLWVTAADDGELLRVDPATKRIRA